MSLVDLVDGVEDLLPAKVHNVLSEIAKEVDSHRQLLQEVGALGGPAGETVATGLGDVAAAVESKPAATTAPTENSTDGGDAEDPTPTSGSVEETGKPGNAEQALPYEQWPTED